MVAAASAADGGLNEVDRKSTERRGVERLPLMAATTRPPVRCGGERRTRHGFELVSSGKRKKKQRACTVPSEERNEKGGHRREGEGKGEKDGRKRESKEKRE